MVGDGLCQPACLVPACDFDHRDCECDNVIETDSGYRTDGTRFSAHTTRTACLVAGYCGPRLPGIRNLTLSFQRASLPSARMTCSGCTTGSSDGQGLYPGGLSGTLQPHSVTSSGPAILLTFKPTQA